jgi:hypothetical protein
MIRNIFARAGAMVALAVALTPYAGCEKRLKPEECDALRGEAFQELNKAQPCASDADCQQSEWPGCEKPLAKKTHADKIQGLQAKFVEGKCEEKKADCRKPPPVYCKQGLCVHKEAGMPVMDDAPVITP